MAHRIVHFEIPCDDPQKMIQFYQDVFGWSFQKFGDEEYWLAVTGEDAAPGINGGLMKRKHPQQPVVNTIDVDDLDAMAQKIELAGGVIVVPRMPVPGVGWLAYFKDPDGNIHGIWQIDSSAA